MSAFRPHPSALSDIIALQEQEEAALLRAEMVLGRIGRHAPSGHGSPISAPRHELRVPDQGKGDKPRVLCAIRSFEPRRFQPTHRRELFSALAHRYFLRGVTSADCIEATRPHQGLPVPFGLSVVRVGQSGLFRSFTVGRQAVNDTSIRGNGRVRSTGASNTSGLPLQTDAGADGADNSIGDTPNLADLVVLSNWSLNWLWIRLGSAGKIFILACDKFITTVTSAEPSPHKLREVPE